MVEISESEYKKMIFEMLSQIMLELKLVNEYKKILNRHGVDLSITRESVGEKP